MRVAVGESLLAAPCLSGKGRPSLPWDCITRWLPRRCHLCRREALLRDQVIFPQTAFRGRAQVTAAAAEGVAQYAVWPLSWTAQFSISG